MSAQIRVAQVLNRMDSGGIEAVLMNYYRHIDREKIQFDFYFAEGSTCPQESELVALGAGIYRIPPYSHVFSYQRALRRAFKAHKYKIVHANLSTMSVFALVAAKHAGVPVRICHNHSTAQWGEGKKTLLKYILRPLNKLFATHWFACSEKAGRWMYGDKAFDAGRVFVMPNAIEAEKYGYDTKARRYLRDEFWLESDAFVVGHIGRFTFAKNHPFLIDVFEQLSARMPKARLLLVGEGEQEAAMKALVREKKLADKVIFTGARRDANKLYSAMDAFCLPSWYEGLGLVAIEAQACGLPCLCSDNVSTEVDVSSECRHLPVKSGDAALWVDALVEIAGRDTRKFGNIGALYDIHIAARKYQKLIESTVM